MITMNRKTHVYIDKAVLSDDSCLILFAELAEKHRPIYLFLHNIWELEEVKHLEQYGYICDVLYGCDMESTVQSYSVDKKQNAKQVVLLVGVEDVTKKYLDRISVYHCGKVDVEHFVKGQHKIYKHKARVVLSILGLCILYFIAYFMMLDYMPLFMVEGMVAFLFALIPAEIFVIAFFYGLYCGVIRWSVLLELLDLA